MKNWNIHLISKHKWTNIDNIINSTIEECYNYLRNKTIIGLDIETTDKYNKLYKGGGLVPQLSDIVMLQIGTLKRQYVIDTRYINIEKLFPLFTNKNITFVGHNMKFEYKHILHKYNVRIESIYDTMLAEQILYNGLNLSNSLNDLNKRYLDYEVDKNIRLSFLTIKNRAFTKSEIIYGAEDIITPLKIKERQELNLEFKDQLECNNLETNFLKVLGDVELKGMNLNTTKWLKLYDKKLINTKFFEKVLNNYVLSRKHEKFINYQLDIFQPGINCNIQWTSSKQVVNYFKTLNICPQAKSKSTKKISYTVESKVLKSSLKTSNKAIKKEYKQLIKIYLRFKELKQATNNFGKTFLNNINPITNRIHSNYRQILLTGRIASSGPNLQNIPSEIGYRKAFDAPKGYDIVNADFSGQESIILVNKSLDKDLLTFYRSGGGDLHSFVAKKLFKELNELPLNEIKSKYPNLRQIAKSANFALAYGGTGFTIANNLGIEPSKGDEVYNEYFKAFPGLNKFFKKVIDRSLKQGYIITDNITGRRFYFKDIKLMNQYKVNKQWRDYYILKGKYERASQNYVIQGEAGSITKYAASLMRTWILDNKLQEKVFITNIVHDEINVECKKEYSTIVCSALEQCMGKSGNRWCKTIKLSAKGVISSYWGH